VQKKSSDKSSKPSSKSSSIPFKKWDKKKEKNPVLVAAAKKMFERSISDDAKKAALRASGDKAGHPP
jgi:hypothetical protein